MPSIFSESLWSDNCIKIQVWHTTYLGMRGGGQTIGAGLRGQHVRVWGGGLLKRLPRSFQLLHFLRSILQMHKANQYNLWLEFTNLKHSQNAVHVTWYCFHHQYFYCNDFLNEVFNMIVKCFQEEALFITIHLHLKHKLFSDIMLKVC